MIHTRTYLLKWVLFQQSLEMDLTNEQLLTHLRDVEVLAEDVLADKQVSRPLQPLFTLPPTNAKATQHLHPLCIALAGDCRPRQEAASKS